MRLHLHRLNRTVGSFRWTPRDPARVLWTLVGLALSATLIGVGGNYLFHGGRLDPALHALDSVPGALRVHGGVLTALAGANVWALAAISQRFNRRAWMLHRWSSILTVFYALSCTLVGGYFEVNQNTFWYGLAAVLSTLLLILPPPFPRQEHDLHNSDLTADSSNRG